MIKQSRSIVARARAKHIPLAATVAWLVLATSVASLAQPSTRPTARGTSRPSQADLEARRAESERQMAAYRQRTQEQADQLIAQLRQQLQSNPRQTVDSLNRSDMVTLLNARRYAEIEEFVIAGSIAVARDTWAVEQLNRFRVRALLAGSKPHQALAAARGLFNVAGMGSVPHDLKLLTECLVAAYPDNRGIANQFRLQQLAAAQPDPEQRKKALEGLGAPVIAGIRIDAKPFESAIAARRNASEFDALYGLGNLLLLSGRVTEAREVFERAYKAAPPTELNYASEAIAKVLKAEDGSVGRANDFVAAITAKQ